MVPEDSNQKGPGDLSMDIIVIACWFFFFFYNFFKCLFFESERERQRTSWEGAEREGDPESEAGSRLRAVRTEPDVGL